MTSDTWHMWDGSFGAMCQMHIKSNKGLSATHVGHVSQLERVEIQRYDKRIREIQENQWRGDMWKRGHPT